VNAEVLPESLTNGAQPTPYVMTQPHYIEAYPGNPFYPTPDYAGYTHAYGVDPQYGYYAQGSETSYGYPVPLQPDGSVDYNYTLYPSAHYAPDVKP
jgi:hypothetical protein